MNYKTFLASRFLQRAALILLLIAIVSIRMLDALPDRRDQILHHVLLFKWKSSVSQAQVREVKETLTRLTSKVDGFTGCEIIEITSGDYDHVAILKFNSDAAMAEYQAHEDHQNLVQESPRLIESFLEYDYWY